MSSFWTLVDYYTEKAFQFLKRVSGRTTFTTLSSTAGKLRVTDERTVGPRNVGSLPRSIEWNCVGGL